MNYHRNCKSGACELKDGDHSVVICSCLMSVSVLLLFRGHHPVPEGQAEGDAGRVG